MRKKVVATAADPDFSAIGIKNIVVAKQKIS
jgi:hypothetical protein